MSNSSIWSIDRTLSGVTTPDLNGFGSDGSERVTLHSPKLQHYWSLTIRLFSVISRICVWGGLILLQRCSQCILCLRQMSWLTLNKLGYYVIVIYIITKEVECWYYVESTLSKNHILVAYQPNAFIPDLTMSFDFFQSENHCWNPVDKAADGGPQKWILHIDKLTSICITDSSNKIKQKFFYIVAVSVLPYGCTTWTSTNVWRKKLDGNYSRKLSVVLNKILEAAPYMATYLPSHKPSK